MSRIANKGKFLTFDDLFEAAYKWRDLVPILFYLKLFVQLSRPATQKECQVDLWEAFPDIASHFLQEEERPIA